MIASVDCNKKKKINDEIKTEHYQGQIFADYLNWLKSSAVTVKKSGVWVWYDTVWNYDTVRFNFEEKYRWKLCTIVFGILRYSTKYGIIFSILHRTLFGGLI